MRPSFDDTAIVRLVLDRHELGGAVLDVDILDRTLARRHRGLAIHKLFFSPSSDPGGEERIGASTVHWHPIPYPARAERPDLPRLLEALGDRFHRIVDREQPSLFVNHVPENPSGFFLSRIARSKSLPVCAVFHGGSRPSAALDDEHARAMDVVAANLRVAAGFADLVAAVSESAGRMIPMARVHDLGTAADASFFDPARVPAGALRRRFDLPPALPVFLLAGRIVPEKGHKVMLDASSILSERLIDHRIVFAGSVKPDVRRRLDEYIEINGYSPMVRILEDATQEEMVSIYRDADVVVLPTFHFEGRPRCLIEAGLMEKPVVATDSGGSREAFVPGVTGLLVPVGDAPALAEALATLTGDPALRASMGAAGRRFASERFDPDALAERHEAAYAAIMARA
jgi:glycosyltransferase involved in cell wall biosynthesis